MQRPSPPARRAWPTLLVLTVLVQLVVLYVPRAPSVAERGGLDKVIHFAVFAAPTLAALLAGYRWRWLVPVLALHAPVSELVQHWLLPQRDGSVADAVADLAGVAVAAAVGLVWRRGRRLVG